MSGGWSRWLAYAKAKLDDVVRQGHRELDQAEADLEAEAAGKPWLRPEGDAPSVDQVAEKIRHRAEQAGRPGPPGDHQPEHDPNQPSLPGLAPEPTASPTAGAAAGSSGDEDPVQQFDRAEQERRSAERLEQIRRELGLDQGEQG